MGADLGGVKPGDVVAVWGAGGVGQVAARAALLLGAERVISIDRIPERLQQAEKYMGVETIDYTKTDVTAELKERSGGRGPDVCIEAVGMEAHSTGADFLYDQAKQQLHSARAAHAAPGCLGHVGRQHGTHHADRQSVPAPSSPVRRVSLHLRGGRDQWPDAPG